MNKQNVNMLKKCGPYLSISVPAFRFIDPYCKCRSVGTDKNPLAVLLFYQVKCDVISLP